MSPREAYKRYIIILQANGITDKVQSDKQRFAINYNKAQNEIVEFLIERKSEDDNRYIQKIRVLNKNIEKKGSDSQSDHFPLEDDYFELIDVLGFGSKDSCKKKKLHLNEIKGENLNQVLCDEFTKPSFSYREALYIISDDKVKVYRDDFDVDCIELSYYRYPKQIELENPKNPESEFKDEDLEFDDRLVERILNLAASQHSLNNNNYNKSQALKSEVINKI